MLKVLVIPPKQSDSAHQLVQLFCKLYEPLMAKASV